MKVVPTINRTGNRADTKGDTDMGFFDRFRKNKEDKKKETKRQKVPKEESRDAAPTKKEAPAKESSSKDYSKTWHITKRESDGKWQVKGEGNEKATRLFDTKAEAEEYAKTLRTNNEGSKVVRHKKGGEFQKK